MDIQQLYLDHIASYRLHVSSLMHGDPDAEIIIVGEYPNAQDAAGSHPFSSASGKMLWNQLRNYGILRPHCYSTYVVKRQVTKNDSVEAMEHSLWYEAFQYELSLLTKKKVIVALGDTAIHALLGVTGIHNYRGSVLHMADGTPVVCSYNPSAISRRPELDIVFAMDIEKVSKVHKNEYEPHPVRTIINPSYEEAMDYLDRIRRQHKRFSVDLESTNMETACVGLGISPHDAMCVNFRDRLTNRYTAEQEYHFLRSFVDTCDRDDTYVIAQNGNFDSYFMGFKDRAMFKVDFDTLLAHHTLYPRLPHNLGFLTAQYTNHPYYKDEINAFKEGGNIDEFWEYNGKDCAITYAVAAKEEDELREQNLWTFFTEHVMRLQPHLSESTVTGVLVDIDRKAQLSKELGADITALRDKTLSLACKASRDPELEVNFNSHTQMKKLLYGKLGLNAQSGSSDRKARDAMIADPRTSMDSKEFLVSLNKYSEEHKFFSTYVETMIDPDDRFRAEFKQYGVSKAPGRLSSAQTLWGSGGNAQNQPHRAYEMYLADQGCVFIYFDLAQAEARYVAWDAWIENWIEDFEKARLVGGFDAHRSLAATMFKIPYDEVPKDDWLDDQGRSLKDPNCNKALLTMTKRFVAKRCRHGLNYRMHIARLAETTGMSYAEAATNFYTYHRVTPELAAWWGDVEREIRKNRMLFNAFGRRFIALERLEDSTIMDSIIAFKPQSSIGDKTQKVWYQCHEDPRWDKNRARIALNVHDALYGIATPSFAKTALSIMKKYAEEPIMVKRTKDGKINPMIIPADCKMSAAVEGYKYHRMSDLRDCNIEKAA